MIGMTQKSFAEHSGYDKSHVSRLQKAGRLVLHEDGSIDAAASMARIAETADPSRAGVAERHARARAETAASGQDAADLIGRGYKFHQARKMKADADMAEVELAEKQRRLIPVEAADFALADLAAAVRGRLELLPASLTPALSALDGPAQIEAYLVEVVEAELSQLSAHIKRAAGDLKGDVA